MAMQERYCISALNIVLPLKAIHPHSTYRSILLLLLGIGLQWMRRNKYQGRSVGEQGQLVSPLVATVVWLTDWYIPYSHYSFLHLFVDSLWVRLSRGPSSCHAVAEYKKEPSLKVIRTEK